VTSAPPRRGARLPANSRSLPDFASRVVPAVAGIGVTAFFAAALYFTLTTYARLTSPPWEWGVLLLAPVLLALWAALVRFAERVGATPFVAGFLFAVLLVRVWWLLTVPTAPASDFALLHSAAAAAASGDLDFVDRAYFRDWTYQLGFVFYQAAVMRVFGDALVWLQLLNALFMTATCLLVYVLGRSMFGERAAFAALVGYGLYLPPILGASVLTNQHLATMLFVLGITVLLRGARLDPWRAVAAASAVGLGHVIRPLGPVVLVAVGVYVVFLMVSRDDRMRLALAGALFLVGFYGTFFAVSATFMVSGITETHLGNNNPQWKFVLGLNHETAGGYSAEDAALVAEAGSEEEREALQAALIAERTADVPGVLQLMLVKFARMWGEPDTLLFWAAAEVLNPGAFRLWKLLMVGQYAVVMFAGLFARRRLRRADGSALVLVSALIGTYASVHLLIEIQTRYRYFAMPFVLLLAGAGVATLMDRCAAALRRRPNPRGEGASGAGTAA
jgi:hypothetical protein